MKEKSGQSGSAGAVKRQARRLLAARERERRAFAALLHDDIGQMLTALKLNLGDPHLAGLDGQAGTLVEDSRRLVADLVERVRGLMTDLYPAMLDDLGLADTVRFSLERAGKAGGFRGELSEFGMEQPLPGDVAAATYRVIQEALSNVSRHAAASEVGVTLLREGGWLRFEVADDGRGFDVELARNTPEPGGAFGLHGMEAWVMLLGGTLQVDSSPGAGTRIRGSIPVGATNNNNSPGAS